MKKINFKEVVLESFFGYGSFANMLEPKGFKIGEGALEFYRDLAALKLGNEVNVSFSVTKVKNSSQKPVISLMEYHSKCGEAILPLDGDIIVGIAPATPVGEFPLEKIEAFIIHRGTIVVLNPGVWHGAPFLYQCQSVSILIAVPERTYANDSVVYQIPERDQIEIAL